MVHIPISEGISILNQTAVVRTKGENLSFKVLYWGHHPQHLHNPIHKHAFYEICYVRDGSGEYMDYKHIYPLTKGTFFVSRPGISHQITSQHGLDLVWVAFEVVPEASTEDAYQCYQYLANTTNVVVPHSEQSSSASLWSTLLMETTSVHPFHRETTLHLVHALLASFYTLFSDKQEKERAVISHSNISTLLHQAKLYIRDNLERPLRLDDIAGYLHISGRHLSRLFANELGCNFTQYVQQERAKQAKHYLRTTDISIKEVAELTGFTSVHYFTRVFKDQIGVPPAAFRSKEEEEHET
ncbi:helix-turn-helix domain-containing protein [Bacillaceae bacterium SIJ1]|uniref:AraC family transcriptional regulator n=1 Tax=Litoribacterium kuwaitense TaxID=1398745 RepID=UPI0013EB38C4|nr:AraC family transcriptional regulator [Litoribacterium kuwaitense]NGP46028.1 helix-turn-helix domain-containing protein [Litoribacterium kuwaitense]